MRKRPDPEVRAWFSRQSEVSLSVISVEEIVFGLRRRSLLEKEAWFRRFLHGPVQVLPVDMGDVLWAGERRAMLDRDGRTVSQADALLAAAAWRSGLVLATRNVRDFEGFGIPLLNPFERRG
jgi:predicted nucleic acid-binding protein